MLRPTVFTVLGLGILVIVAVLPCSRLATTTPALRRVTTTGEEVLNLNPSLSGDGRFLAFESTFDLAGTGSNAFHALLADLQATPAGFAEMGSTRAVAPAISQHGSHITFSSHGDPLGTNADGNSEIFFYRNGDLHQLTQTLTDENTNRITDGNFQPSISDDGRYVAFASNRDLTGQNSDGNFEIYVYDTNFDTLDQPTQTLDLPGSSAVKISGNGNTIAYIRETATSRDLVLRSRVDPTSPQVVASDMPTLRLAYGRAISDDGLRVVYSAEREPNASQLFLWDGRNNVTRQLTSLEARDEDVPFQASISGDGLRVSFATRRNVIGGNSDHSVELYIFDIPSGRIESVTRAPASATAEIVSSLNDDGSLVAFNFPRVLSGAVSSSTFANNSEIYLASISPRPAFGTISILNGAAPIASPAIDEAIAPGSNALAQGAALAFTTQESTRQADGSFSSRVAGTTVTVNGRAAQIFFVSPEQVNFCVPTATEIGLAEIAVANADGFISKSTVSIEPVAPGVFNTNGQGIILNADTLQAGPFDPSGGTLRLSLFATGVRNAVNASVTAAGRPLALESVSASPDLPGLDELHVLVPAAFRGAGTIPLVVHADNRRSNPVEVTFAGVQAATVLINEVLADPPDGPAGDANHDGVRSSAEDEFVELVSTGGAVNISGWTIRTRSLGGINETTRHTFPSGSVLLAGEAMVMFGGGNFDPANPLFGCARVTHTSTAGLSLVNGGLTLLVRDAAGTLITEFTYGGATGLEGDNNQSLTRSPDISGVFVEHTAASGANGRRFSPGLKTDGTPLAVCPGRLHALTLSPSLPTINIGEMVSLVARPVDIYGRSLPNVLVNFASDNPAVATVDSVIVDEASGTFTATITGHNPGTARINAEASSGETIVTAALTITVSAPSAVPLLVINQVYGGGNNSGATFQNDFVELFNRGTSVVDFSVTPYSLVYASASGNFTSANKLNLSSGNLAPGQFFLVRLAGGTSNGIPLPSPDASSSAINLSAADGKVALVVGTTLLVGNGCPLNITVADFVGYGAANCAEGSAVGALNAVRSARRVNRCSDTNSNAIDFALVTNPSTPQNSVAPLQPCQ
ncbi:MAG: lamin tail domain-containing protein [Pyrinomonadaceae bacterium]